ncbi:MAG: hypothetical protein MRZ79_06320 [Bacteroidia bacterium]|nr:hypothetical protein [Bacteroidia bacterium]
MKNSFVQISMFIFAAVVLITFKSGMAGESESMDNKNILIAQQAMLDVAKPGSTTDYRFMVKGEIKQLSIQKGDCKMLIQTKEGLLEVCEMPEHDYKLKVGQSLIISYETLQKPASCGADKSIAMYDFDLGK